MNEAVADARQEVSGHVRKLASSLIVLWPLTKGLRATIAGIVLLGLAGSLVEGLGLGLAVLVLQVLLGDGLVSTMPPPLSTLASWTGGGMGSGLLLLCLVLVPRGMIAGLSMLASTRLSSIVADRVRRRLFANFMFVDYGYVSAKGASSMIATLDWEALFVPETLNDVAAILTSACALLVLGGYLVYLSPAVAVLAAVLAAPLFGTMLLSGRVLGPPSDRRLKSFQLHTDLTVAALEAIRTLRLHHAQAQRVEAEARISAVIAGEEVTLARRRGLLKPLRQGATLLLGGLFIFGLRVMGVAGGELVTIAAVLLRLLPHVGTIEERLMHLFGNAAAVANVARTIEATEPPAAFVSGERYNGDFRAVAFENVSFSYPGGSNAALKGVDLRLRRGTLTIVIGPSGSGKTTLVNLLGRLFEPTRGRILVDGQDLAAVDAGDWLARTGFSGQDVELFSGTVLDNVRLGQPEISIAEAGEALCLAGALGFVETLPLGLHTPLGDRGQRLSGGQRQRIGLARALARQPTLLVLDEAANAVQPAMERSILASIRQARPDLTLLVVSHRGDVVGADQIVEISDGLARSTDEVEVLAL